jgi:hypothetical protein
MQIAERALLARINRIMSHEGGMVRKCRPTSRWYSELGDFYAIQNNTITAKHIDLAKWGRDLKALKPYEELAEGGVPQR